MFGSDPVGLPGLAAMATGFVLFFLSLLAARGRGKASVLALIAVAGVTALDITCARKLTTDKERLHGPKRDYSDRSGMPESPDNMRGAGRQELKRVRALS